MGSDSSRSEDEEFRPPPRRQCEGAGASDAVPALLRQLAEEPSEPAECAAKFSLYEGYASEVENMRNTLFKFYEESCPLLPPAIVMGMDRQMRGIDTAEAMQIPDESREWFVFHMMRQAERNNKK